jgi:hypothetical protein
VDDPRIVRRGDGLAGLKEGCQEPGLIVGGGASGVEDLPQGALFTVARNSLASFLGYGKLHHAPFMASENSGRGVAGACA